MLCADAHHEMDTALLPGGSVTGWSAILFAAVPALLAVLATGLVGAGLASLWNFQLKRREQASDAAKRFHELYGEFFAVWKLWNYCIRGQVEPPPNDSRWRLLERACAAESGMEATLAALCARSRLGRSSIDDLGRFRQAHQQLRESIRDNRPLDWDRFDHVEYRAFKQLAPRVARLVRSGHGPRGRRTERAVKAWLAVTSNRFEDFWAEGDL